MPITIGQRALETTELHQFKPGVSYAEVFGNGDKDHPLTCGIFTLENNAPTTMEYKYGGEFTLVLEGEVEVEDLAKPGEIRKLGAGDIVRVDKGSTLKWSSPTKGKGYYVIQMGAGTDPTLYLV